MESKNVQAIKIYPLSLGEMWSDSNGHVWGDTKATAANPHAEHRMNRTPSLAFAIQHPQAGWILYDTGMPDDPGAAWPQFMLDGVIWKKPEGTKMTEQLAKIGLSPSDISYVVSSHMHMDHIGNDHLFARTADFIVSKPEAEFAYCSVMASTKPETRGYYIKDEVLLERKSITYVDQDTELFPGIEAIICPGHTPGVLVLVIHAEGGTYILAEDALNEQRNFDGRLPGGVYDSLGYRKIIRRIRDLAKKYDAQVFFGHDAQQFDAIKKAPEYYA